MAEIADFRDAVVRGIQRYRRDPIAFIVEVLGVPEHLIWSGMRQMAESVRDNRRTAVAGSHSSSKTFTASCLVWWWLMCFQPAKVITTAPTGRQTAGTLWAQIRQRYADSLIPLGGRLLQEAWHLTPEIYAMGFTTRQDSAKEGATAFQGFKSENMLLIFDEAVCIERGTWTSARGILTFPHNHWLVMANPTDPASEMAGCWRKDSGWNCINLDAFDSPNVKAGKLVHPYLPTVEWIDEQRADYGEGSPFWEARVRGRFPSEAIDTLISVNDLLAALGRAPGPVTSYPVSIGCDVARFGDDMTVLMVVQGTVIKHVESYNGRDLVFTAGRVRDLAERFQMRKSEAHRIAVDDTGVGGGVTDILRSNGWGVNAENFGEKPAKSVNAEKHKNRRTELWVDMADWIRKEAALSTLEPRWVRWLESDLPGTKYEYLPDERIALEPKKKMKERLGHSPDHGDALALALAYRTRHGISRPMDFDGKDDTTPDPYQHGTHPEDRQERTRRPAGLAELLASRMNR